MSKISFIFFDVGGVLIKDLSTPIGWLKIVRGFGLNYLQAIKLKWLYKKYEPSFCRGEYDDQQIKELIEQKLGIQLEDKLSITKMIVSNFSPNEKMHNLIDQKLNKYKKGLLTNMNIGMLDEIKRKNLMPKTKWDIVVDSSVIHMAKPASDIYEFAQSQVNVPKEEILFVDNLKVNLEIPSKLGWQTFWYDNSDFDHSTKELERILSH